MCLAAGYMPSSQYSRNISSLCALLCSSACVGVKKGGGGWILIFKKFLNLPLLCLGDFCFANLLSFVRLERQKIPKNLMSNCKILKAQVISSWKKKRLTYISKFFGMKSMKILTWNSNWTRECLSIMSRVFRPFLTYLLRPLV